MLQRTNVVVKFRGIVHYWKSVSVLNALKDFFVPFNTCLLHDWQVFIFHVLWHTLKVLEGNKIVPSFCKRNFRDCDIFAKSVIFWDINVTFCFQPHPGSSSTRDKVSPLVVASLQGNAVPTWGPKHYQTLPGEDRGCFGTDEQGKIQHDPWYWGPYFGVNFDHLWIKHGGCGTGLGTIFSFWKMWHMP